MSSDSVRRFSSRAGLYSCPTNSLCKLSFKWLTRKCITAFGTLQRQRDWMSNLLKTWNQKLIHVASTCPGCFYGQWGNTTWWASRWPRSPSVHEQTVSGRPAQAGQRSEQINTHLLWPCWKMPLKESTERFLCSQCLYTLFKSFLWHNQMYLCFMDSPHQVGSLRVLSVV